jgi:flagellar biosynthesis/type III secretory pathway protein FliH
VGVALSALMKPGENSRDSVERKWKAIRTILRSRVSESGKILLTNVVHNYSPLSPPEAVQYEQLVATTATKEERNMISYWEQLGLEKGLRQGIEQGIEQGVQQGQRAIVTDLLESKYGNLSDTVTARVQSMTETELSSLARRILTASTLTELGLMS